MKWVFLAGLMLMTPFLAMYLRQYSSKLPLAAFALGFLPFIEAGFKLSASPITWPAWQGFVKGVTVSPVDAIAFAMIVASSGKVQTPLRLKLAFLAFVMAYILSTVLAPAMTPAMFYGWQLVRCLLVFYAVSRACTMNPAVAGGLLSGMFAGLIIQGFVVIGQYAQGYLQAPGWFGHQNSLGMVTHFIVYMAFALFLGGYYKRLAGATVMAGLVVAYAGGSRATIGLMLMGLALTLLLSLLHSRTKRKTGFMAAGILLAVAITPIMYGAVERRSDETRASSSALRDRMLDAASMIIADHPLGIGANRYVVVANMGGYSARAGVEWTSAAAPVHNTYYLVGVEMGWPGLIALITFLVACLTLALQVRKRAPPGMPAEIANGVTVAIIMFSIHSYFEWISMAYASHVFLAMNLGLLVAARNAVSRTAAPVRRSAPPRAYPLAPAPSGSLALDQGR